MTTFPNKVAFLGWTAEQFPATLSDDNMANGSIANEILRQLGSLGEKIDAVDSNLSEKIDDVNTQLGGHDGIRERLTALEVRVEALADNTPASSYPPPNKNKKKSSIKDHATTVGVGAGGAGVVVALSEIIPEILKLIKGQ